MESSEPSLEGPAKTFLDSERVGERMRGKVVMVTGAGGSIGAELCRQAAVFNPRALVGFDQAETPLFLLERELQRSFPSLDFHGEIGSITRPDDVRRVMERHRPSFVYHAAAYKHVSMMERQVFAAVENNIFGTAIVANAAVAAGVESFVLVSTDKAVRPASVMGVTKRVAELVIGSLQRATGTRFVSVRFGNVIESSGSVIPIFKAQIAAGGPVTVTDAAMTRYFMTGPEAAQLVLQAFVLGKGGEVFVLDMGKPVRILDLARTLILEAGLEPDQDIQIEFTGARPGEKLFEELDLDTEFLRATADPRVRSLVSQRPAVAEIMTKFLEDLQQAVAAHDSLRVIRLLEEMVPEYAPSAQSLGEAPTTRS